MDTPETLIARLDAEIATLEWHIKGCENEMHAWEVGCPYCKRDERLKKLLRDAAHALSGATPKGVHRLDCDEYHQHVAPKCCALDCWCREAS